MGVGKTFCAAWVGLKSRTGRRLATARGHKSTVKCYLRLPQMPYSRGWGRAAGADALGLELLTLAYAYYFWHKTLSSSVLTSFISLLGCQLLPDILASWNVCLLRLLLLLFLLLFAVSFLEFASL